MDFQINQKICMYFDSLFGGSWSQHGSKILPNASADKHALQWTAPRIGPLTEEEAMEYLCMKDLPRKCWAEEHNRPMFKIVRTEEVPSDRQFRNAWEMAA